MRRDLRTCSTSNYDRPALTEGPKSLTLFHSRPALVPTGERAALNSTQSTILL
jgi:hypothetical protein